ncbi:DNA starvation/stationary phase protection protein [Roseibium denhamense]|uniref:Starvation-inducible DNA-binding protein n=1 Tax=Roseibium denhamense TaxID=76305 RepID=A0ABY1PG62_9HYPH|nr:DNA starvation/stationary phase protection protein [Roseibium denhamense]MTI07819.1 DNA starvation/stationary phase protection protein [Roseibium denhamense]SMP31936.1 starvation-inducible DNA-binding protein [Roseibium denhamense]
MQNAAIKNMSDASTATIDALNGCVADTVVATLLSQNYHWNVKGMNFLPLHQFFQEIYEDHFEAQDDLAERIKAMGGHVEATLGEITERTAVRERPGTFNDVAMIEHMLETQQTLASTMATCATIAAEKGDTLTEDLCIARGQQHEKFAWMLRAHLRG